MMRSLDRAVPMDFSALLALPAMLARDSKL